MSLFAASGDGADVFLSIKTKRAGALKGESRSADHTDEIAVHGFSWGMHASSAIGSVQATARRSYKHLTVSKRIDSSSTALMSVLATNDEVKEAKLSMRKAGEGQRDYFTIALQNARVVSLDIECNEHGEAVERIAIAFTKLQVDYEVQKASGQRGAGFSFQDEVLAIG